MTITKTIKMNHVTPGTVLSGELNKSSKSNSPIIMTPVFTIARPGAPKAGTVRCVRESQVSVEVSAIFLHQNTKIFAWSRESLLRVAFAYNGFSFITGGNPGHYGLTGGVPSLTGCVPVYLQVSLVLPWGHSLEGRVGPLTR